MSSKMNATKKLTLSGMVTALSVLFLFAAAMLPVGSIPFCFLASITPYVLACEGAYAFAFLSFIASSGISFFILPDRFPAYLYILLLGHYGIIRTIIQTRVANRGVRFLLKLTYCNVFLVLGLYLAYAFLAGFALPLPEWLSPWGAAILMQPLCILYDALYGASTLIYQTQFRRIFISRK